MGAASDAESCAKFGADLAGLALPGEAEIGDGNSLKVHGMAGLERDGVARFTLPWPKRKVEVVHWVVHDVRPGHDLFLAILGGNEVMPGTDFKLAVRSVDFEDHFVVSVGGFTGFAKVSDRV